MKRIQALPLAALLALQVNAQSAVTSYFSICPSSSTTTVTVDTTVTICPGPNCGTTTIDYVANPVTTVGPDGKTTVYEAIAYTAPCPCEGGVCDAVYTVTRDCPCTAAHNPTDIPAGFTANAVPCTACAMNGGPSTVTVITPVPSGPYASQTPAMGTPYNGASAYAVASAYASAGSNGAAANAGSNAAASAGSNNAAASAGASSGASASDMTSIPSNGTATTPISPAIPSYTGSANKAVYAASAIIAGAIGSLAWLL